jgi:hypothetical protein
LQANAGDRHPLAILLLRNVCALEWSTRDAVSAKRDCGNALALSLALHGKRHPETIAVHRQLAAIDVPASTAAR